MCFFISYTEFSPIYESINFDAAAAYAFTKITTTIKPKNTDPIEPTAHPLQRQNAFDGSEGGADRVVKRKQTDKRDVRDFLERCIPPPPVTSPPPAPTQDLDSDSDNTEQALDDDPVHISHRTLMKLNSLYSVYKMRRSDCSEMEEADRTVKTDDMTDDVVLRLHNKVDKCKSRLFRGSSKAMCSFASVCLFIVLVFAVRFNFPFFFQNVEDDYLPRLNGLKNEDEHNDDGDNGCTNLTTANGTIGKHSNDAHCRKQQQQQQPEKPICTQNDEVYI